MKKKVLSLILVFCLLFTSAPMMTLAADGNGYADPDPNTYYSDFDLTIKEIIATSTDEFTVTLTGKSDDVNGLKYNVPVYGKENIENTTSMTFTGSVVGIANGTYTLTIEGKNYLTYTQDVTVNDNCATVVVYNEDSVNYGRDGDNYAKYGVIAIGDVNGDNAINEEDAELIVNAIGTSNLDYDLSGDGIVDETDLAYAVRNFDGGAEATVVHTASVRAIKAHAAVADESTNVAVKGAEGKDVLDVLFSADSDAVVSVAPEHEGKVSEDNAATLAINVTTETAPEEGKIPAGTVETEAITIVPPVDSESKITAGTLTVVGYDENGNEVTIEASLSETPASDKQTFNTVNRVAAIAAVAAADEEPVSANGTTVESDGTIVIDLGQKVAIKKISIRVTGTTNGNLAEIAKVEFLGDFSERIPEPKLSIPTIDPNSIKITEGEHKSITFSWSKETNITGYEVSIKGPGVDVQRTTSDTTYTFLSDDKIAVLEAFKDYELQVRSVSGSWKSDWSTAVTANIDVKSVPNAPEYLNVTSEVNGLSVSWRKLYDTEWWNVYYRKVGTTNWTAAREAGVNDPVANRLTTPSCKINGLDGGERYEVYVVGMNRNGASPASAIAIGQTSTASGVMLPQFNAINVNNMDGIASVTGKGNVSFKTKNGVFSGEDAAANNYWEEVLFDNDPNTYFVINDWDNGVNYVTSFRGPIVTFTDVHTMDTIRMTAMPGAIGFISRVVVTYKDANDNDAVKSVSGGVNTKYDSNRNAYYEITLDAPITTNYIELRSTTGWTREISIAELRFYDYDSTLNDAKALFTDVAQIKLRDDVTQATIDEIRARAKTPDAKHDNEINPRLDAIEVLLARAELVLNSHVEDEVVKVSKKVSSGADGHTGMAMALSPNQPIGYVAAAGDTITVLVGDNDSSAATGAATNLQLVVSQYHPEVNSWSKSVQRLYIGSNEITIPAISSAAKELGGSLYIAYSGGRNDAGSYSVRVVGATKIPMLNVAGLDDEARHTAIDTYVTELENYVASIESKHNELHKGAKFADGSANTNVDYAYNEKECFLNSTEIVMDQLMFSFPATQVLEGLGNGDHASKVTNLENALKADEEEVDLFYQFKGLHKNEPSNSTDRYPTQRLNIRYHQMFTGAFMYAGGQHIGIEYGSVSGLFNTTPVVTETGAAGDGKYVSGGYSGWGIAHEIGHVINTALYTYAEVTNNVFAQLAGAENESNDSFRTTFDKVYNAVVSGNTGHTGDLAVQLAMFWQLHLAYDDSYAYRKYISAEDAQNNLFYARVDSYLRNPSAYNAKHTEEGFIPLTTNGSKDDVFVKAACAAANKNLLAFFDAWGITYSADTAAFASQFQKETRLIQYIDNDSRLYRIENNGTGAKGADITAKFNTEVKNRIVTTNEIELTVTTSTPDDILGYEVRRNGKLVNFVVCKGETTTFTDFIGTENNKAFVYTVTGVDKLLNTTKTAVLDEIKVMGTPVIDRTKWTVSTSTMNPSDTTAGETLDHSGVIPEYGFEKMFDGKNETAYSGSADYLASFTIDLGATEQITAIQIVPGDESTKNASFTVMVSQDGNSWEFVKAVNNLTEDVDKDNYTFYFSKENDPFMYTFDAQYVQIMFWQADISVAEINLLGPTNDNIDIKAFGSLEKEYQYSAGEDYVIPQGAVLFYGEFSGDPSYSVVVLKDQDGNILSGDQVILADVPAAGYLGETNDGAWLYWLTDENGEILSADDIELTSVQAELYRVQNAETLEGQRLTSTSLHETVGNIPSITITGGDIPGKSSNASALSISATVMINAAAPLASAESAASDALTVSRDPVILTTEYEEDKDTTTATFDVNSTSNPYVLHFTVDVDTIVDSEVAKLTGETGSAKVIDVNVNTEALKNDKYFVTTRYTDTTVDVYVAAKYEGIASNVTGTITVDTENIVRKGAHTVEFSTSGFNRTDSFYNTEEVVSKVADSIVLLCEVHSIIKVDTKATCTTDGAQYDYCEYCQITGNFVVVPATGHTESEVIVDKEPTCTEKGSWHIECLECGEVLQKGTIEATGHRDEDGDGICDNGQGTENEHPMKDNNGKLSYEEFHCKWCTKYELKKGTALEPIFKMVHFIVHFFSYLTYLIKF